MRRVSTALAGCCLLLLSISAWAHHSTNAYDMSRTVVLKGSFRQFDYQNPHIILNLDVPQADGKLTSFQIEGPPPGWFRQAGIRRTDFDKGIGQTVSVDVHPSKDGTAVAFFQKITFADGTSLSFVAQ